MHIRHYAGNLHTAAFLQHLHSRIKDRLIPAEFINNQTLHTGFFILFNVHDWGSILCALGGVFTWMTYLLCRDLGMSIYSMNFFAAVVSALYSELMARSRKYPVTSYLVISLLPLVPGAGIYYTMSLGLGGDVQAAVHKGLETAGVAGSIAVAILLVSTIFRLVTAQNGKSRK